MSATLVEQLSGDFDPAAFHDDYQDELRVLIEEKIRQGKSLETASTFGSAESSGSMDEDSPEDVTDLLEALRRSIDINRDSRESAGPTRRTTGSTAGKNGSDQPRKKRRAEG